MPQTIAPLSGLIAAPYTAFHSDGSLNLAVIEKQAASLLANGVAGAFVCGTTGEGLSMSIAERRQVAERWQQIAGSKLRVIVHTGHSALGEARQLAAHAQEIGASGVGCLAPFFFKPADADMLAAFCAEVAGAAPKLPFYYYHIPSMTGVNIPAAEFLRAAGPRIPNLRGVKFTFENLVDFAECAGLEGGRYEAIFGRDEMLVGALATGCRAAIGSTYNFLAPVFHQIIAAFKKGDLALVRERQAAANTVIQILTQYGGLAAGKAAMKIIGIDCGPTRLPLRTLDESRQRQLRVELESAGFAAICSQV